MPSIDFFLPHWVYWGVLLVFPLLATIMARRGHQRRYAIPTAYMILVAGGILGLHRFYLRSLLGLVYLPLFLLILFANAEGRDARETQSEASNAVNRAEAAIERTEPIVEGADARLEQLRGELEEAQEGSTIARIRAERALENAQDEIERSTERLEEARTQLEQAQPRLEAATEARSLWSSVGRYALIAIGVLLVIDAVLVPGMVRRCNAALTPEDLGETGAQARLDEAESEAAESDFQRVGTGWPGMLDRISYYTGEFVAYWVVIAVFVYYFEVVARYVFNSPTIWAHEGMYLMFGMQYLIAGAYAALTDAHVKVDIFYAKWSPQRKALVDLFTSIFFFIFAGTLIVTGWIFAMDATRVGEISFSEWQIAYWPFKWTIALGGVLLFLQGIAKLARDIETVRQSFRGA